jgi:FkbM family methyltransferase
MYPETHSQFDEEQAICGYFERHATGQIGLFLDVGAWDPICFSNTRKLYEQGWRGVMIEPSPTPMLSLLKAYGSDDKMILVQAALGMEDSILPFQMTDDSVSTSDAESYSKWKDHAKFLGRCYVRMITWSQVNLWYGGFDFCNIDAEGISVDLFKAMLASGAKPACVCVEHDSRLVELAAVATAQRYRLLYSNGTNAVFGL